MTEKINGNSPRWFWPLYLAMLPILMVLIITMIGYYISDLKEEIEKQGKGLENLCDDVDELKANQRNISRILYFDPDTSPDNKDELRPIFHNTREGKR